MTRLDKHTNISYIQYRPTTETVMSVVKYA